MWKKQGKYESGLDEDVRQERSLYSQEEERGIMIASLGALVEHHGKQGHADVHAVLDLAPPRRARVVLEVVGELLVLGQRCSTIVLGLHLASVALSTT